MVTKGERRLLRCLVTLGRFVAEHQVRPRDCDSRGMVHSARYHGLLLLAYILPIVFLAKQIASPLDYGISVLGAPASLGGLLVAVLILSPESMAAVRSALANRLQRSINLALGTALSSISLTIPAVLIIGFITGRTIILGLEPTLAILLALTLVVSIVHFESFHVHQGSLVGRAAAWVWFAVYAIAPVGAFAALVAQLRASGADPPRRSLLPTRSTGSSSPNSCVRSGFNPARYWSSPWGGTPRRLRLWRRCGSPRAPPTR